MQYTFNPFTDKLDAVGTSGMGPGSLDTLSGNDGVIVSPVGNNISLYGIGGNYLFSAGAGTIHVNNLYWLSQYVVDPNATPGLNATYQTIQAAINAANASGSGGTVMIRKGTYTENITLYPNVNLVGFSGLSLFPNTIIKGTVTANFTGSCTLTNISITENVGSPFQMAGSGAMYIFCDNIEIASTNTANIIGSNASSQMIMFSSVVAQNGANPFFALTGGNIGSFNTFWQDGGSTTQSSLSASTFAINGGQGFAGLTLSSGSSAQLRNVAVQANAGPAFTINDTSSLDLLYVVSQALDGTSTSIATTSASASANINFCQLASGATYAITGAGSIQYDHMSFNGTNLLDPALSITSLSTLPLAQAAGSPGGGLAGHCYFNSADFSVDSTGFVSSSGSSSVNWNTTSVNLAPMLKNNGYICVSPGGALTLQLPAVSVLGDEIIVTLDGATSFQITQGAGQSIRLANVSTTAGAGGSITSTQQGDTITMVCQTANLKWNVISSIGNLTVV